MAQLIRTPDQGIRVFVSSTLDELAAERLVVRAAIESLRLVPVMFELGARPHPARETYRAYLRQSHIFVGIYGSRYGWVAPGQAMSGLEDELRLSAGMPRLLYIKRATEPVDPRLRSMLDDLTREGALTYRSFDGPTDLADLVAGDLATLVAERYLANADDPAVPPPVDAPPVPSTTTVGRDDDLRDLAGLVRGGARLVTITGPGGTGKSRLALEVARRLAADFPDGVAFTPLEDVTDPSAVLSSLARSLHTRGSGNRPLREVLIERLAARRVLLVIDNMEQVAAAGPELAGVLDHAPQTAAIVTSRQPLHLRGEQEYPLAPLAVADDTAVADLPSVPAVALFLQRVRAIRPRHRATRDELLAIAELCRRLDGLPLAIELAAARTRMIPPRALLERVSRHLDDLGQGAADLPTRQLTMRATLDWSYHLLDEPEQQLLARCSVFAGASPDAVHAVTADSPDVDTDTLLASLADKNLVVIEDPTDTRGPRIRMLQTIRSYAADQLDERGETDLVRARHAAWYRDLCEPADVLRHAAAASHWPILETEIGNLRHAAEWAIEAGDFPLLVDLGRRLWPWLRSTGRLVELRQVTQRALADIPHDLDAPHLGTLYDIAAYITGLGGDLEAGLALAERAIEALHSPGVADPQQLAHAHLTRALIRSASAEPDDVSRELDEVIAVGRERHSPWLVGNATSARGLLAAVNGDLELARASLTKTLEAATALDNPGLIAQAHSLLALTDIAAGRLDRAGRHLREAADRLDSEDDIEGLANALDVAAALANADRRWDDALSASTAATALRQRAAIPPWPLLRSYHQQTRCTARHHASDDPGPRPNTVDPLTELRRQLSVSTLRRAVDGVKPASTAPL